MKITGIDIDEYRQFKDIKFDFTYPKGHPKEGQPLEKVCFIGQSGTGKTTLLNVIWDFFQVIKVGDRILRYSDFSPSFSPFGTFKNRISIYVKINNIDTTFSNETLEEQPAGSAFIRWAHENHISEYIASCNSIYSLFIKDSIAREADAFLFDQKDHPQTFSDFVKTDVQVENEKGMRDMLVGQAGQNKIVSLGDMQSISIWQYLLKDIIEYDETTVTQIRSIVQNTPKNKFQEELQKWLEADPRHELAEKCLNPILNKFFLELETNAGNVPITLRTTGNVKIDSSYLSTGTRQLLATSIPLYKFDTTDTVILFDEPERSLFPDIQQELVKHYTSLAPEAQFFFATHSPFVASAFEPCERFILYFDENGEVKCRKGVAPIGDDPNDILSEDFGLNELMLDEGLAAYDRYRKLGVAVRNEIDPNRKNELIAERAKLGDDYKF